jgi:PAS domain S-box-containing protein
MKKAQSVSPRKVPSKPRLRRPITTPDLTQRLQLALEAASLGIWDFDLEKGILIWDDRCKALFGLPPQAKVDYDVFLAGLHPEDRAATDAQVQLSLQTKAPYDIEYRTIGLQDGVERWIHATGQAIFLKKKVVRFIGTVRDITERKRHEEILQQAQTRLAAIVESSEDAIISKNLQGIITSWNHGAERLFGYTAQEIIGQPILLLIPPDRYPEEADIIQRIRQGQPIDHYETVRRHQSGSLLNVSLTVSPMKDERGKIIGASKIARDITDRQRGKDLVREAAERLRLALSAANLGDWQWEADSDLLQLSYRAAAIFGVSDQASLTRSALRQLLHPEDRDRALQAMQQAIRDKTDYDIEYQVIRADGRLCWVAAKGRATYDDNDRPLGMLGVVLDITERKKAEEELKLAQAQLRAHAHDLEKRVEERTASLQRAVEQMEEFSYSVSHDLRAPVRAMYGYAQALQEDYAEKMDEQARNYLDRIVRAGQRMDRLMQDLLTYTRVSRREMPFQIIALKTLVPEIILQYPEMQSPQAEIHIRQPLAPAIGHEPSLAQALSNLLANAVKFVRPGTRADIVIWTERIGSVVRLYLQDHGIGIRPDQQARLFGMFERAVSDKDYEGTGIGLAIVRKALERMNGKVGLQSDGTTGSTFWLELPAAES